eukprot:CAMPEP_0202486966 /NCGR_PEP_ID=MMETSP1361-20130828/5416_1 /ASSEMBLY_ACC=CAM_ASM_000849 /TAXON_ID=210615 /ORGANISM="Staurosira complex sp., Strain CCMP2646" /LENGTH=102 /DNA_ID=CAMNT_0049116251 /DNA_START=48 /DNA_END=356 /DNA_ORIENTATION=+
MVRVWYEPPPYGVGTSLNRPPYGTADTGSKWLQKLARVPQWQVMVGSVAIAMTLSAIPLMNQKLPHTMSPEYQAASRAYMRYHNMNPIFGVSSKEARAKDAH